MQQDRFPEEFKLITNNKPVKKGPLVMYNPYIEKETGLIRVGERIEKADIPFEQKHPIILQNINTEIKNSISAKIIWSAHVYTLNGGTG